ncbi:hypothetical protein ml_360 [Mollivirus sibericum]|uniref:hypothetical protein n=1 Tax=Mollivirus sibericum TaxID=1678078 RepID=UPI0006B2EE9D|nr:hypothetical protein ml_360 [Mollivirus sibericum]ALD62162.1 hypothetical protein ml_360 [Mollivirus sibericum]QHN71322.1 hypothetical protein [Mollivirus kamchatka]
MAGRWIDARRRLASIAGGLCGSMAGAELVFFASDVKRLTKGERMGHNASRVVVLGCAYLGGFVCFMWPAVALPMVVVTIL